jgi:bacillithiol system protein YtxJ
MNWINLETSNDLNIATEASEDGYVMLFKHSVTCSISHMAKMRIESKWNSVVENKIKPYYLDLKSHRSISTEIAERFEVHHESPQVLLLKNGKCIYDASHLDISVDEISEAIEFNERA